VSPRIWSDEDRLLIPRMGGWTINFKYIARKLGWAKPHEGTDAADESTHVPGAPLNASREDRLKNAVERSRYEDDAPS